MSNRCPGDGGAESGAAGALVGRQYRARGAQPGNSNARKHGLSTLQRRLSDAGLAKVDGRSALARARADWMNEVRTARGGDLSPSEEALLEAASVTWVLLSSVDAWLLEQPSLVNRRRRELLPVVQQRASLVRNLRELLGDIGLKRVPPPGPSLRQKMAEYGARGADAQGAREGAQREPRMGTPRLSS